MAATTTYLVTIFLLTTAFLPASICLFDNPLEKLSFHASWSFYRFASILETFRPIGIAIDKLRKGGEPAGEVAKIIQERINEAIRINKNEISEKCAEHLLYYAEKANSNVNVNDKSTLLWNRQIVDAYGTISVNNADDFRYWAGDYKQCLRLNVYKECVTSDNTTCHDKKEPDFEGKYCLASVQVPLYTNIVMGMCFPSTCSANEMTVIFKTVKIPNIDVKLNEDECQTNKSNNDWDMTSTLILILFVILFAIVFLSTIRDILTELMKKYNDTNNLTIEKFKESNRGTGIKMLTAFSAYRNTKKVFNTESRGEKNLECLDGIRAITMSWIVIGHVAAQMYMTQPFKNPMVTRYIVQDFWIQCLINAEFAVDTFIFMAGFLLLYTTLKHLTNAAGKLNLVQFYFHRLVRITPAFAITLAFICGLFQHTAIGPFWPNLASFNLEECRKVWWKNLLYINVYNEDKEWCMTQSWYLCLDTFYYAVSPLLFIPLFRKPKLGLLLLVACILSSIVVPGYLIHVHELAPINTWQMRYEQRQDYLYEIYTKPWNRMHVFLIGMLCGLIYFRKRDHFKMNKIFVAVMWLLVSTMMFLLVYGTHPYSSGIRNMTRNMFSFYGTFARPAWAVGVGWITLACLSGYGGVINTILTWKLFVPISRISYSYYLVHYSIIVHYYAQRKENFTIDVYLMSYIMIVVFMLSSIFAYILSMLVESPIIELEKVLLRKTPTTKSTTNNDSDNNTKSQVRKHDQQFVVIEPTNEDEIERGYDTADSEVYWDLKNEVEKFENSSE